MKKFLVLVFAVCFLFTGSLFAKKASLKINAGATSIYDGIGIGFFTGGENVLSIKKFIDKDNALQFGLGWAYWGGVDLSMDYLFNNFTLIEVDPGTFICYWGLGAHAGIWSNSFDAGIRVPFGISYVFEKVPLDITLQIVPQIGFGSGGIFGYPTGGIGVRYYL
jgi:hypothetical protein